MKPLRKGHRRLLAKSAAFYHQTLLELPREHEAWTWLRAQVPDYERVVSHFQLGWSSEPFAEEHAYCKDRLSMPNITVDGDGNEIIVGLKFRTLDPEVEDSKKFFVPKNQPVRLYDLRSIKQADDTVGVSEGETDCWAAWASGLPTVCVPGASTFGDAYRLRLFAGFSRVLLLKDSDDAAQALVDALAPIDGLEVITFGVHKDCRAFVKAEGADAFRRKLLPRAHELEDED